MRDDPPNTGQLPNNGKVDFSEFTYPNGIPQLDTVYVVKNTYTNISGVQVLQLAGLPCIHKESGKETGFDARQYRKLDEIKNKNKSIKYNVK